MRQIVKWSLLVAVLGASIWMVNVSVKKVNAEKTIKEKITIQPELKLLDLDSVTIDNSFFPLEITVFIYFNSECDHCQYETKDIKNNITSFSNATIVFMSSESLMKIGAFAEWSGLNDHKNILFTKISSDDAFRAFGPLAVPHVFIYGSNKKLRKEFKGETKAEAILKYIN